MGAFGANVKTATQSHRGPQDNQAASGGALNLKAMTSATALSGTNGAECARVTGDTWQIRTGNKTETISGWSHLTVSGDEIHKILKNYTFRVNGTTNDTRVDVHNQTNIAPRNDCFMHTRSEIHHQPECREQKTEDNEKGNDIFKYDSKVFAWHLLMIDTFGMRFEFNTTMNFEKKLLNVGANIFVIEDRAFAVEMEEIKGSLGALATEIKAGKIKAAATHIKAIAGNINAGIALNADSPFG